MKDQESFSADAHTETQWVVITGAPCCGKSTLIQGLRSAGHDVCEEAAERYVLSQRRIGKTTAQIIEDRRALITAITRLSLDQEMMLPKKKRIFLDRSAFDTVAYCAVFGEPIPHQEEIFRHRYAAVFVLDRVQLTEDRLEREEEAAALDRALQEQYVMSGHIVVRVPVLYIADRLRFVLSHLPSLSHE